MSLPVAKLERECKLTGWAGFEVPDLTDVDDDIVAIARPEQQLDATYYDTADLRLARAGITVRFRTGEGGRGAAKGKWTVKLPEGSEGPALSRREIDVEAPGRTVPDAVASLVRAHIRSAPLVVAGQLLTRRRRVELRDAGGTALVEVADDEVSVLDGRRAAVRFREIEVELLHSAPERLLQRVVARLREAGAEIGEQTPKIVRALGPRAIAPPDVGLPDLDNDASLADVVGAAIAAGFTRILRHDPGVRLGGDSEDVHQARVAARRLRSDLRTFRSLLDTAGSDPLREELQWLGAALGRVRDADVLLERLQKQAATLPATDAKAAAALLRRLDTERSASGEEVRAVLDSDRYVRLLDTLADASVRPPVNVEAKAPARKALPPLVRGPWKHLERAVDALGDDPDDEALHDLRIRAKRARYAAEAAAPVLGKPATRYAKAAAGLQGVLGDLQDAVVAESWLRGAATRGPVAHALVAGQLIAAEREAMAAARSDWPAAWAEVASKKIRSFLH